METTCLCLLFLISNSFNNNLFIHRFIYFIYLIHSFTYLIIYFELSFVDEVLYTIWRSHCKVCHSREGFGNQCDKEKGCKHVKKMSVTPNIYEYNFLSLLYITTILLLTHGDTKYEIFWHSFAIWVWKWCTKVPYII